MSGKARRAMMVASWTTVLAAWVPVFIPMPRWWRWTIMFIWAVQFAVILRDLWQTRHIRREIERSRQECEIAMALFAATVEHVRRSENAKWN